MLGIETLLLNLSNNYILDEFGLKHVCKDWNGLDCSWMKHDNLLSKLVNTKNEACTLRGCLFWAYSSGQIYRKSIWKDEDLVLHVSTLIYFSDLQRPKQSIALPTLSMLQFFKL